MQDRRDTGDEGYTKIDSEIARISPQEETFAFTVKDENFNLR